MEREREFIFEIHILATSIITKGNYYTHNDERFRRYSIWLSQHEIYIAQLAFLRGGEGA